MDEKLVEALAEFRRAYSQWEDRAGSRDVAPSANAVTRESLFRLGDRMRDAMVTIDNLMSAGQPHPYRWPVHPADVHDGLCPCRCQRGLHCGGCGHAGCGYRP